MRVVSACRPDFYQAMSDGDTDRDASNKRVTKAVDRTLNFLDSVLDLHHKSEVLSLLNSKKVQKKIAV